nr:immunoglobulin heavy chain junction region [Macaca mulatta]MOV39600.1 immunoglobulin heavy chain junction region [Macaca mulatta]MOV40375.1 immunoglobulin heavy chain junction region [Macaca mulatta]MOV41222.1 immunoglobulin heavy chain junction region [Macaca mulatta]MOV41227.1 immunoglobulin heavy chain junction region [Macaca mulatta]
CTRDREEGFYNIWTGYYTGDYW